MQFFYMILGINPIYSWTLFCTEVKIYGKGLIFMKMTGAQIIIETLIEQGVTDVFGYPGGQVLNIYDELYKNSDRIKHYLTAHEQGAAHAADGYFRASGKTGVCIATSGPGATNLVTGIATAMLDSVSMVAITGNVPCELIGKDAFQEIDITGITLPITKHNYFVNDVNELAASIREAFQIARSGRPGPVLIDVPKDVQLAVCDYESQKPVELFEQEKAAEESIQAAVEIINTAKRPYIYVGGGMLGSGLQQDVMDFADKIDAVIGSSFMGLSAISTDCERFLGMQGMHGRYSSSMAQSRADVIICVGVRFSDRATGDKARYKGNAKIVQLELDFAEVNKNITADVSVMGDVCESFKKIAARVEERQNPQWMELIEGFRKAEAEMLSKGDELSPFKAFDIINSYTDKNTVIATDVGQHQMWTAQFCSFRKPRTLVSSGGLGTMGFGLGAAIGACCASGEHTVLITGDGSFGMNLNELATAVSYNLPITVVIFNNGVLGMVRQWQTLFYEKRYSSTTLGRRTDFVKLAEAFGAKGYRAESAEEFDEVFKKAFSEEAPSVIDCRINEDEFVLPMLPPGGSIDDIIVER